MLPFPLSEIELKGRSLVLLLLLLLFSGTGVKSVLEIISNSFQLERERAQSTFTPEMISTIKRARTYKIENKTRERERERRGEITSRVRRRMRQGPPAHVLATMSEEERRVDGVMREVSLGGYSGRVKAEEKAKRRRQDVSARELASSSSSAVAG